MAVTLSVSEYGVLPDGRAVTQFALASSSGVKVSLLDYGATLASVELPDRDGRVAEVTHGYDDLAGWLGDTNYFGATIGRVGNRIAAGKFSLEGKDYVLATNNLPAGRPCHLHGGIAGFNRRGWSGRALERADAKGVEFSYLSPDGEEGYPGELRVTTTYWLNDADELTIEFHATTDRRTIVNLTNHTYWNLTGDPAQPITGHLLQLEADGMLPVDAGLIPTGKIAPVRGTPFDFTQEKPIGADLDTKNEQLEFGAGYDHCWVLNHPGSLRRVASARDSQSGRGFELWSDQRGMQLYTGNFLDGSVSGRGGVRYQARTAFCLEPQGFPDAPNQPQFPSVELRPGEDYAHTIRYRFSANA